MYKSTINIEMRNLDVQVEFRGYRRSGAMKGYSLRTFGETDEDMLAMTAQPEVRTFSGTKRKVWIKYEVIFNFEEFSMEYIWHELYHVACSLHRMLDSFRPQNEDIAYEVDNEEFVCVFVGKLYSLVAKNVQPRILREWRKTQGEAK